MVAAGGAAMGVSWYRGDPKAIWLTLGYFTVMEEPGGSPCSMPSPGRSSQAC
jgi:hypothetical protein